MSEDGRERTTVDLGYWAAVGRFVDANGLRLHVVDRPGTGPPILLLHGLTSNGHGFGGLISAGFGSGRRLLAPDLRGRGRSDQPEHGYGLADHAADAVGLLDALDLERVVLAGHSFGGQLALYLCAHYPERFDRLLLIDVPGAAVSHPKLVEVLAPTLRRLETTWPSWSDYIAEMRRLPPLGGVWNEALEHYFRADVAIAGDGSVATRARIGPIRETIDKGRAVDWAGILSRVGHPAVLLHAGEPYGPAGAIPIVSEEQARATVEALADCRYLPVPGNHLTMLYGDGAVRITAEVSAFLAG